MTRGRLLDLFSCEGGAAAGYALAGWDVTGVDIDQQPRYLASGASRFIRADALEFLAAHGHEYDAIHASPPCQRFSRAGKIREGHKAGRRDHPDLVGPCRELLVASGRPWVIENVPGAPLRDPSVLCGLMFGLRVLRHRLFETSFLLFSPDHPRHPEGVLVHKRGTYDRGQGRFVCLAGNNFCPRAGSLAMGGIGWMTRAGMAQAVPPAYTRFIGLQLRNLLETR